MTNFNTLNGVGVAGMSWTFHVSGTASPAAYPTTIAMEAIPAPRKRHAAAAAASVNRGTT